jgi:hypothetical protein
MRGEGGGKRRPSWQGRDTGGHMPRRASGLPSLRCRGTSSTEASTQTVVQMTGPVSPWGSLPRKGIDVCGVSCRQQVLGLLTGLAHGLGEA